MSDKISETVENQQQQQHRHRHSLKSSHLHVYNGGCHCKAIRWRFHGPRKPVVWHCNCTICTMKQNHHIIVPGTHFELLHGKDKLSTYTFGTHTAQHYFCSVCGVQSFYVPRSNPDGFGINVYCIDDGDLKEVEIRTFEGSDWSKGFHDTGIATLSNAKTDKTGESRTSHKSVATTPLTAKGERDTVAEPTRGKTAGNDSHSHNDTDGHHHHSHHHNSHG